MGKPIWVDSVTKGKPVKMGFTDGDTLTCYKKASDKLYSMDNRVALDDGGLHQAKSRDVTRVIIFVDGVKFMDNHINQWLATELVRLGYGEKKENPQHTLGPQDVDTMDASLL